MTTLWQDIRHACRVFGKNPGFTAIAVIPIAFGTGANVAIFSAADALLLRPLPVARPSELVTVGSRTLFGLATASHRIPFGLPRHPGAQSEPAWCG